MISLGLQATFLSEMDLASADLNQFDVIIHGVRTYAARPELTTHNGRLMDYVEKGGVVVVQYNTPEYDHNFGPYPYEMSRSPEEVTDQGSPIKILRPDHPVLSWPNKITATDFEGWVEQRGSKFLKTWDERYEPLIETHDQGQPPQKADSSTRVTGKESMSIAPMLSTGSFRKAFPEPTACCQFSKLTEESIGPEKQ